MIASIPEMPGYTVKQYSNALDALENMKTDQVDLAVFDLMLPGISGIDAIKKIRETDQELPILIIFYYIYTFFHYFHILYIILT